MKDIIDFPLTSTSQSGNSKNKISIFKYHSTCIFGGENYRKNVTVEILHNGLLDAIATGRLLPRDELSQMGWVESTIQPWLMGMDEDPKKIWDFIIQVGRYHEESDDEFLKRQQELQKYEVKKSKEEKELYLRLKAKYEPTSI